MEITFFANEVGLVLRGELCEKQYTVHNGKLPQVGDVIMAKVDLEAFAELEVSGIDAGSDSGIQIYFKVSKILSSSSLSAQECWQTMQKDAIPSKKTIHPLFTDKIREQSQRPQGVRILDLGCGDGSVILQISDDIIDGGGSVSIVGIDVNAQAVSYANECSAARARGNAKFLVGDICAADLTASHPPFDIVLCQLVISVIGGLQQRQVLPVRFHPQSRSSAAMLA